MLAVVAYHAGLPGAGFVGVDIFFVISGFLITSLLLREDRIDFWTFYARRARRILPALVVVVACTFIAGALLLPAKSVLQLGDSAIAGLLMIANLYVPTVSGGYFDGATHLMPLMHLWSLGVEEQFYLVWPVVLAFTPRRWLGMALGALCVSSLMASELAPQESAFYGAPFRLWELGAGGLLAYSGRTGRAFHANAGVALLAIAVAVPTPVFPGVGALPAVLGSLLVIYGGGAGLGGRLLQTKPMVLIGLVSYSLYLWHWPLLAIDRALRVGESPLMVRIALCAAAFALACLTYAAVERPFRGMRPMLPKPRVVALAAGAMATMVAAVLVGQQPARDRREFERYAENLTHDVPELFDRCMKVEWSPTDELPGAECRTGDGALTVLWGDSHALTWLPAVEQLGGAVQAYALAACAPALGFDSGQEPTQVEACRAFTERVVQRIQASGVDRVVIAARWPSLIGEIRLSREALLATGLPSAAARARRESAWPGIEAMLGRIAPHVREVVILGPLPQLSAGIERCVLLDADCGMSREEFEALRGDALPRLSAIVHNHSNVRIVDPSSYFCPRDRCLMQRDGIYLYVDDNHISATAARAFASHAPDALRLASSASAATASSR